jgi:hypothetical protein
MASVQSAINATFYATLYEKLNFNFIRDIAPVAGVMRFPLVIVVNSSVPVKTVPEFIAYAKANRGKLNMGSSGVGSLQHIAGELFKMMTGVDLVHVPVSRRRSCGCRSARRTDAGDVRPYARVDRTHQSGQVASAGCDDRGTSGYAARNPNCERIPGRLRGR